MIGLLIALLGAALYRWRGASHRLKKYFPRPFNQIVFAAPYAIICYPVIGWWCLVVLLLSTLGVLTGHGNFMDLGTWKKDDDEDETLEFIIKPLKGRIPEYWYDAIGLAVTGIAVSLPAGIVLMNPLIALSGALKAPAYMIGWKMFYGDAATERGEWLTGFFLWGSLWTLI